MKKTLLSLFALAFALGSLAEPVNQQQALQQARKFFSAHGITMTSTAPTMRAKAAVGTQSSTSTSAYYVFNAGDGKGFAIISGDDRTEPVLGYSLNGSLSEDNMPDNMRSFLQSYAEQIEYIQKNNITIKKAPATADRTHIAPMLTTTWNQDEPYNNACPIFLNGARSVTGCVATAMAQVLYYNYQQHRSSMVTATQAQIPSYQCSRLWTGGQLSVSAVRANSSIDWANMQLNYTNDETDAQKTAIANLMFYCGASVRMDYADDRNGGSSASLASVPDAFKNYFGFDASTRYVSRDAGDYTTRQWNDLVYNELANNRVVLYGGQSSAGSGHAFVINGYDANNFFYVNWGWGGLGDGSYLLSILEPTGTGTGAGTVGSGYNLQQDIIINAEPDHGGVATIAVNPMNFSQNGNTLSYTAQNIGSETISFNYGYGAVASDGTVTVLGTTRTINNLGQNEYQIDYSRRPITVTLDISTLSDGTYNIVPIAKLTSSSTWQSLWVGKTLNVTVRNGNVTYNNAEGTPSLSASDITVSGANTAGRNSTITTTLTNNGDGDFEGTLYLFASTSSSKGTALESVPAGVLAGGTADLSTDWTPTAAGTYNLWLCSDSRGNNVLATGSVTIAEGNGQYALTLNSMTVNGEDLSSRATDSQGRTVTNVSGNSLVGSYTLTANQTIAAGTQFATFIEKLNETTGQYEDYTTQAYSGRSFSSAYFRSDLSAGSSYSFDFSFTNLPNGSYIIRPEVGTLRASYYYYMSPELWYDDSRVYVLGASTGIDATEVQKSDIVTVYNLQGMKVATISRDRLSTLPHGVYIVDGKKIAVK